MGLLIDLWWLPAATFFTAIITAVSGAGGGVLLLGLMGLVLPAGAVIPLHGAVMSLQNLSRGALLWRHVDWRFVGVGTVGSVVGAVVAGPVSVQLPEVAMRFVLGMGLLYLVWMPRFKKPLALPGLRPEVATVLLTMATSIVSMLIGAAGVLFSAIRKRAGRPKEGVLADQSWLMLVQHLMKVVVFGLAGFVFGPYLPLVAVMIVCGLAGTLVGVKVLRRMESAWFDRVFKAMVSALALLMLGQALGVVR